MGSYVSTTINEEKEMLNAIGVNSIDDLFKNIPEEVKINGELNLPSGLSEMEVRKVMENISNKNKVFSSIFRGAGAYKHYIPSMVSSVTSKEEFVTAYTPYQAEISQGILQSIFEYQTMICNLTGMDVSNASVYDGATAAAEALAMCRDRKHNKAYVSGATNPQVIETMKTYCKGSEMELIIVPEKDGVTDIEFLKNSLAEGAACLYIQQPNFYGNIEDADELGNIIHNAGGKYIMGVYPISLGAIKTPREFGADIAVGEGQSLGIPLSCGGPYLGFMACIDSMVRKLPGRIVGETTDAEGKRAFVLTLQAREQHIRREKASSNICSNEALCALTASVYLATMGSKGIKEVASQSMSKARYLAKRLKVVGQSLKYNKEFFNEFVTISEKPSSLVLKALEDKGILGGYPLSNNEILWCCTETNSKKDIDKVVEILKEV